MRVLRTLTGSAAHLPARNAYEAREPFPACTPVGTAVSNGVTRFYFHTADAVTCKRCLRILEKLVTEARAMHAQHMMTPEGQAQEDALAARRAERCGQCDSERSNPRHHSAEGHAFVDAEKRRLSGMYVELSSGLTEHVEPGDRLQHKDSGTLATVTAVGPNALDLLTDDDTRRSGASWYWGRPTAPAAGPIDRVAVLSTRVDSLLHSGALAEKWSAPLTEGRGTPESATQPAPETCGQRWVAEVASCPRCGQNAEAHAHLRAGCRCTAPGQECTAEDCPNTAYLAPERRLYTPTGEAMTVLGSAVRGGRTGLWGVREGRPLALAFFVDEDHLRLQFSAYRPGERARLADAARVATPVATPSQVAELAAPSQVAELAVSIAEQAELFAAGGVSEADGPAFRARMGDSVKRLAQWLGMSEPVSLASFASPYDANPPAEYWQARAGVQPLLCRLASSRWTTYGATCNTPLSADGTCPEAHAHV